MPEIPDFFFTIWPHVIALTDVVLVTISVSHVVLTKPDTRAAIGWVGIILLAPFIGSLLYVLFGVNRIHRTARRLRRGVSGPGRAEFQPSTPEAINRTLGEEAPHLRPLMEFVRRITDLPLLDGNRITPLVGGDEAYADMLAAINEAKCSIGLSTYIFDNDDVGLLFVDALEQAQQRGVEVRILIDDVGSRYTLPPVTWVLRRRGIRYAKFLPTLIPWKLHYSNLRSHRKILVVDGDIGFTGGMNIRQGHRLSDPGSHPIQDIHFRIEGPVVAHLRETFASDWEFCTGERLTGENWFQRLEPRGFTLCRGIPDGPEAQMEQLQYTLQCAIDCARKSIVIVTPYFLPEPALITALTVAAMRGVQVQIVLPEKNNLTMVQWACFGQLGQVLERGCRVWLSAPPFDHSKLVIVDGCWVLLGSANWDPRSLRLNFEFNVECYDRELAQAATQIAQEKMRSGREIQLADVEGRHIVWRIRDGIARLAQPYL
jgi:cardiolipin synthase A/B